MTSSCLDESSLECRRKCCAEFENVVIEFRLDFACIHVICLDYNNADFLFWYYNYVLCGSFDSTCSRLWSSASFPGSDFVLVVRRYLCKCANFNLYAQVCAVFSHVTRGSTEECRRNAGFRLVCYLKRHVFSETRSS